MHEQVCTCRRQKWASVLVSLYYTVFSLSVAWRSHNHSAAAVDWACINYHYGAEEHCSLLS